MTRSLSARSAVLTSAQSSPPSISMWPCTVFSQLGSSGAFRLMRFGDSEMKGSGRRATRGSREAIEICTRYLREDQLPPKTRLALEHLLPLPPPAVHP